MRLIDADALRNEMYNSVFLQDTEMMKWDSGCWIRYKLFENCLKAQSTVDAAPVRHGRWEGKETSDAYDVYGVKTWAVKRKCSVCGFVHKFIEAHMCYGFCPNCGAKMDLEGEN